MATLKVHKTTALPGTLEADSIYFVAPAAAPDLVEVYVTNSAGDVARRVLNRADVQGMIDAATLASSTMAVVPDIAARDALAPSTVTYAYVQDATGDASVASGGATYLYTPATSSWIKTSEAESMDLSLTWAALSGKPASTPAAIDGAVTAAHTHPNKTQLDLLDQNGDGELTYNGVQVKTAWTTLGW